VRLTRGLLLASVLAAALALGSSAAAGPAQDGTLTVRDGRGEIVVRAKGSIIGRLGKGTLTISVDRDEGATIVARGAERTRNWNGKTTVYSGTNIRFRIAHNRRVVVKLNGRAIFFSAVGRGEGWMDGRGDPAAGIFFDGSYSLNGEPYQSLPDLRTPFELILPPPPGSGSSAGWLG
jgi:hypothetical protein